MELYKCVAVLMQEGGEGCIFEGKELCVPRIAA